MRTAFRVLVGKPKAKRLFDYINSNTETDVNSYCVYVETALNALPSR